LQENSFTGTLDWLAKQRSRRQLC